VVFGTKSTAFTTGLAGLESLGGCYLGSASSGSPSNWVMSSAPHLSVRFGLRLRLLMNCEPWYRSRIPVRRLGTLHGFEAGEIPSLARPAEWALLSTELGPDREAVRVSGESVSCWFGSQSF
jgi:hypothetical protein